MDEKRLKTDVLVIGGGISGLTAAITAKQTDPGLDVLVVDKAAASKGWAGKAARNTGLISYVTREDDAEDFVKHCVEEIGFYLNDQDLLREMAFSSRQVLQTVAGWGVGFLRDADGEMVYAKWPTPWGTAAIDPDMCVAMVKKAKDGGVRMLDRTVMVHLLTSGGHVCGMVGFDIREKTFVVIEAKAIVFAHGNQDYMITTGWCATGNAIAASFEAGAEMRNAEFGNMCDFARVAPEGWMYYGAHGGAHIAHDHLYTKDENISQKYRPGFHSSMDPLAAYAWYKETLAGNGPVFVDLSDFAQKEGVLFKWHPTAAKRRAVLAKKTKLPENKKFDVVPGFLGELSCISVNHQMETTLPGLFAVGDASGSGCARCGAAPAPPGKIHGTGMLNAFFTGMKGGAAAATSARALSGLEGCIPVESGQVERMRTEMFEPLFRTDGISPSEMINRIQDIVAPVDYSLVKTEARMQAALGEIEALKPELDKLGAQDGHELAKCIDAKAMLLCAELFFRASLERKESRGFHLREDYPTQDDAEWLKWVYLCKNGDGMELFTRPVPIENYRYQPHETDPKPFYHALVNK